jgi:hypothetical protein
MKLLDLRSVARRLRSKEKIEIIKKHIGHTYSDWKDVTIPDVDKQGLQTRICSICNYEESKILPPTEFKNLDVLQISVDESTIYECNNEKEASMRQ